MLDDVFLRKLESLRHCIRRIEEKRPLSVDVLNKDYDIQDIISLNLERAIQLSVDIGSRLLANSERKPPETLGEVFPAMAQAGYLSEELSEKLKKAVGFRNISVHEYQKIDWEIVFSLINKNLGDFKEFMREVSKF